MPKTEECPFDGVVPTSPRPLSVATPSPKSESEMDRIANTPYESLSFKDFAKLKSGRDSFSRMKLLELQGAVSEMDWRLVVAAFMHDDAAQASCMRWMLRGLDCDKAIRKVQTDLEITDKAASKWRSEERR